MVRIGIIGAGAIAEKAFLPGFAEPNSPQAARALPDWSFNGCPDTRVVMLASRNLQKVQSVAAEFQVPHVSTDWRDLVANPDVDAVCITTPNYLHCEMTVAACRAGKHVLVEKPMALTLNEADEMIAAAEDARVVLMVQQTQRFFPVHEVAKEIVDAGALGQILSLRARWSHAGPEYWSPDGKWFFEKDKAGYGAMFDLGIHKFDLIRFLSGKEAVQVSAFTATLAKEIEVEDYGAAILRFADGALGVVEASWASSPPENSIKLYGTKGNLQVGLDSAYPISVEFDTRPGDLTPRLPPGTWQGARYIPDVPKQSVSGGPFRHFVNCLRQGGECIASGADNRKSLEVALAAFQSQASGQVVRLPLKESRGLSTANDL
jgi:UDP-N-acetylglucosamine 3-dehydrogenase